MFLDAAPALQRNDLQSITGADVNVESDDESLDSNTDESYSLTVMAPRIKIQAKSVRGRKKFCDIFFAHFPQRQVFGALRGMESLSQLVDNGNFIQGTHVEDSPRFEHSIELGPFNSSSQVCVPCEHDGYLQTLVADPLIFVLGA